MGLSNLELLKKATQKQTTTANVVSPSVTSPIAGKPSSNLDLLRRSTQQNNRGVINPVVPAVSVESKSTTIFPKVLPPLSTPNAPVFPGEIKPVQSGYKTQIGATPIPQYGYSTVDRSLAVPYLKPLDKKIPVNPLLKPYIDKVSELTRNQNDPIIKALKRPSAEFSKLVTSPAGKAATETTSALVSALNTGAMSTVGGIAGAATRLMDMRPSRLEAGIVDTTKANNIANYVDKTNTQIRQTMDVSDKTAQSFPYQLAESIPQMATLFIPGVGQAAFAASAGGNYATDAERKGATPTQALAMGAIGGASELLTEKLLFLIPKGARTGVSKLIGKTATRLLSPIGEGLQEVVTDPIMALAEKAIYNPDKAWLGDNGVLDFNRMPANFAGGAIMGTVFMGLNSGNPEIKAKAEAIVESGKEAPIEAVNEIQNMLKAEKDGQNNSEIKSYSTPEQMSNYVNNSWNWIGGTPKQSEKLPLFDASPEIVSAVGELTGKDITGYKITLVDNDIRHIRNSHGPETKEGIPVTPEDFIKIPEIINNADRIYSANSNNRTGDENVRFEKRFNGKTYLLGAIVDTAGNIEVKQIVKVPTESIPKFISKSKKVITLAHVPSEDVSRNYAQSESSHLYNNSIPPTSTDFNGTGKGDPSKPSREVTQDNTRITADHPYNDITPPMGETVNGSKSGGNVDGSSQNVLLHPKDVIKQYKNVDTLKQQLENIKSKATLSDEELYFATEVGKGNMLAEDIPARMRWPEILKVVSATKLVDDAQKQIDQYHATNSADRESWAQKMVENSDQWTDKKSGIWYARETQQRNIEDITGENGTADAKRLKDEVFDRISRSNAEKNDFMNTYRDEIKSLGLTEEESYAVQMLGEKAITEVDLPPHINREKVKNAVETFRSIYHEFLDFANVVRVENGYAPIHERKDYYPHFEDPKDPFVKTMALFGFNFQDMVLPTDLAGQTYAFKPGTKYFSNFQKRLGSKTDYDAVLGFDRYLNGISDIIFHTENIQRLRALENAIREKYSTDGINLQVKQTKNNDTLSGEQKQEQIDKLLERDVKHLPNYAINLREYTNLLAGKKSFHDRSSELDYKRGIYNLANYLNKSLARNMVGMNVGSWLNNFIPLTQGAMGVNTKSVLSAMESSIKNMIKNDGFDSGSVFLRNRQGSDPIRRSVVEKITDAAMSPSKWIDEFTSNITVRSKYLDEISRGTSPEEAMKIADSWAAKVIADRSRGALPTFFERKNPLTKFIAQFQIEPNNQISFLFKDLPREARQKGVAWLTGTTLKILVASYLYNQATEKLTGRKPAFDPIGLMVDAVGQRDNPQVMAKNAFQTVMGQVPIVGGLIGGGRLPISAAFPDFAQLGTSAVDLASGNGSPVDALGKMGKALLPTAVYLNPLMGGGQIKKTIEGISAFSQGGSMTNGKMRFPIPQTPVNAVKTALFGQYSPKQAVEYFDKGLKPLSEKQTAQVLKSPDELAAYKEIQTQRAVERFKADVIKLKKNQAMDEKEKARRIQELNKRYQEMLKEKAK